MTSIVSRFLRSPIHTVREERALVKFLTVGALGTVVNLTLSYVLHLFIEAELAQAIGVEISIINNFGWNDSFTFRNVTKDMTGKNQSKLYRLLKYNALSLGTAALNLLVFYFLAYPLGLNHGLWYAISSLVAILTAFVFNYIGSSRWAWKGSESKVSKVEKNLPMVND
ncbi:MAG: GtrA family protein [archaeon]|nr:GtrA family protein [archaeon]